MKTNKKPIEKRESIFNQEYRLKQEAKELLKQLKLEKK